MSGCLLLPHFSWEGLKVYRPGKAGLVWRRLCRRCKCERAPAGAAVLHRPRCCCPHGAAHAIIHLAFAHLHTPHTSSHTRAHMYRLGAAFTGPDPNCFEPSKAEQKGAAFYFSQPTAPWALIEQVGPGLYVWLCSVLLCCSLTVPWAVTKHACGRTPL